MRSDDEDVLANQLSQEGGKSQADVFLTENSPALQRLQEQGLLAPVDGGHAGAGPVEGRLHRSGGGWASPPA